jgi:tetratricopeptide (TPR) repeat protein
VQAECAALPVLLVIEDLHWGDLPSVKLIGYALRAARRQPLMVLALARPEVDELFVRLWADRGVQEIRLAELTPRASERLVRQALGSSASEALIARLVEQADGHAFYLEELIRATAEGTSFDLPRTVVATVQARLAALPQEMRRVLRAASIFGDVFWREGVAALLGNVRVTKVGDCLHELMDRELLVRREASRFPGEDAYGFRHALLREGAYAMLTDQDLKLGHKLAGEWLERSAETDAMRLAEHFERGGEARRAVGYYRKAAEQALDGNDLGAVLSRAARGVLCGASGEDKGALLLVQAEAHAWRGEYVDAERCALAALPNLTPMSPRWCGAITEASAAAQRRGAPDRILELSDLIGEHLDTGNATAKLVIAAARVVRDLYFTGLHENAAALLRRIDPMLFEHSKSDPLAGAIRHLVHGQSAREAGEYGDAVQLYGSAAAEFDRLGDVREVCRARVNLGFGYTELGAYEDAEQTLRQVLTTTEPLGLFSMSAAARHLLGRVCSCLGRFDEARSSLHAAIEFYAAGRQPHLEAAARIDFAMALLRDGDPATAEREALAAIGLLRSIPGARARGLATLAQVRLAEGHPSDAIPVAREATRFLGAKGHCEGDALIRLTLAECLRATGQLPAASAVISAARDRLFTRAAAIQDARFQDSFLSRVAENARTIELAEAWQEPSTDEKFARSSRPTRTESESALDPLLHLREAEEALAEGDADAAIERARRRPDLPAEGPSRASASLEIEACSAASMLLRIVGRRDAAEAVLEQLDRLTRSRSSIDPSATAWRDLARADRARQEAGEPWRALRLDESAFAGFTAAGSPAALLSRANIGLDYGLLGAHENAEEVLREVLAATSRRGYTGLLASIALGATLAFRGAFDEARAPLESAAATERGRGNRYRAGIASSILAEVFLGLDDLKAAERQAMSALDLLSFAPLRRTLALSILALIQLRAGKTADGLANAREARAGREALGASGFRDAFVRRTAIASTPPRRTSTITLSAGASSIASRRTPGRSISPAAGSAKSLGARADAGDLEPRCEHLGHPIGVDHTPLSHPLVRLMHLGAPLVPAAELAEAAPRGRLEQRHVRSSEA